MKTKTIGLLALAAICCTGALTATAQTPQINRGVGILTGASMNSAELPDAAKAFIKLHFGDKKIERCEKEFLAGTYEVDFTDGTDLEFDASGLCTEISAGKRQVLKKSVVASVLPAEAYKTIVAQKLENNVDEISVNPVRGYTVEFTRSSVDDMKFDTAGILTGVDYD